MDRMKTFAKYALLIIVFFIFSIFMENVLLVSMYKDIPCTIDESYNGEDDRFSVINLSANASNTNGYISFELINNSAETIEKCYVKINLYNKQDLLAKTEYIEVKDLKGYESRPFRIKFDANNITRFDISVVEESPDLSNIINILGFEIDTTDIFGFDLSEVPIFGDKIKEMFNVEKLKERGSWFLSWIWNLVSGIPWWAYFIGWMMIVRLI